MNSITVRAHAKVNLFLKVLSKRKDSYHDIQTLFERVSLADTITISRTARGIIVKSDRLITRRAANNLVYKAASAIFKRERVRDGVIIKIKKRIPIAAGLGGGSSDAAATLVGINNLFKLKLSTRALLSLGRILGADVPFFLLNTAFAVGKGIGDNLNIIKTNARFWHIVVYPGFKIKTKDIYDAFDSPSFALTGAGGDVKMIFLPDSKLNYGSVSSMLHNDLEKAAISKKKVLGHILKSLAQLLGRKFIVSGSGPSLFCLYDTRKEALRAKIRILRNLPADKRDGWQIFIVQTW